MPELPEVETIKRDLQKCLIGLSITAVDVYDQRILKTNSAPLFINSVIQKTISRVDRRGKVVIFSLREGGYLLAHPKMTGQLIYGDNLRKEANSRNTKVVISLSNGKFLNYNDQRLFGRLSFVEHLTDDKLLKNLGPEPFEKNFNTGWILQGIKQHRIAIKTLLLDQHFIAGIGNIYASEILFEAGIKPTKPARRLNKSEINALHASTIRVLKEAVKYRGTSMRNYRDSAGRKGKFMNRIKVYNKEESPCPRCAMAIKRIVQNGRSTYFCQGCQL